MKATAVLREGGHARHDADRVRFQPESPGDHRVQRLLRARTRARAPRPRCPARSRPRPSSGRRRSSAATSRTIPAARTPRPLPRGSSMRSATRPIRPDSASRFETMAKEQRPCTDIWWYNAARDASEAEMNDLAVQLADKAVGYSPWSAALGNAGGAYWKAKAWTKLEPVAQRLTQVAPNSPDNWQLLSLALPGPEPGGHDAAGQEGVLRFARQRLQHRREDQREGPGGDVHGGRDQAHDRRHASNSSITPPGRRTEAQAEAKAGPGEAGAAPAAAARGGQAQAARRDAQDRVPRPRRKGLDRQGQHRNGRSGDQPGVHGQAGRATTFKFIVTDPKIVGYRYAPIPADPLSGVGSPCG